jgi:hypothetical protein
VSRQSSFASDTEEAEMSDERRAEIEAVARALHEQGFGFDIDADPVARESMFSVARVVLDRLRDARGDDEALDPPLTDAERNAVRSMRAAVAIVGGGPPAPYDIRGLAAEVVRLRGELAARSPQGEDHEAQEGVESQEEIGPAARQRPGPGTQEGRS